ncbi:hypothetical protein BB934_43955 (plasmid) [Microvirga ossetica]|uniref:Uncharacterized protein n=1 Tax=Microvirga ossetica TaxID=1882682 RepID=A0A1B2EYT5_9HYPH|nr:hypothetical protein [Microvirga ossetica]ANY85154.1 hypothetical protein BB934_43955 [Microvirga ossetica]
MACALDTPDRLRKQFGIFPTTADVLMARCAEQGAHLTGAMAVIDREVPFLATAHRIFGGSKHRAASALRVKKSWVFLGGKAANPQLMTHTCKAPAFAFAISLRIGFHGRGVARAATHRMTVRRSLPPVAFRLPSIATPGPIEMARLVDPKYKEALLSGSTHASLATGNVRVILVDAADTTFAKDDATCRKR